MANSIIEDDDQFCRRLRTVENFKIVQMLKDGNCFYSAVSMHLHKTVQFQADIRQSAKDYLLNPLNADRFRHSLHYLDNETYEQCVERNMKDGQWCDEQTIIATAHSHNLAIHVHRPLSNPTMTYSSAVPTDTVHVSFHGLNHYNLLCAREEDEDDAEIPASGSDLMPYLLRNIFGNARQTTHIVLLVQSCLLGETLTEVFDMNQDEDVYMFAAYTNALLFRVLRDYDLRQTFRVFCTGSNVPMDRDYFPRCQWLSSLLLTPIMVCALNISWKGNQLHPFCVYHQNGKVPEILNHVWSIVRNDVEADLNLIYNNPACYICDNCQPDCLNRSKPWHLDLTSFVEMDYWQDYLTYGVLDSISFFYEYGNDVRPTGVMEKIQQAKRKHSQASTEAIKELIETLDSNAEDKKSNYFGTYLVLLLDGPNMYEHQNKTVLEMLNCKDIKRSVYAGKCKNDDFRAKHFTKLSSLNVLMTGNTRLFFIRKRTFKNKTDADVDEAIMIEILFTYRERIWQKERKRPFYVVNRRYEQAQLLGLTEEQRKVVKNFCNSGIPVFNTDPENSDVYGEGDFCGNYKVIEPVPMLPGPYATRVWDDVQGEYEDLDGKAKTNRLKVGKMRFTRQ